MSFKVIVVLNLIITGIPSIHRKDIKEIIEIIEF